MIMKKQLFLLFGFVFAFAVCRSQNQNDSFMNLHKIPDAISVQTSVSTVQLIYKDLIWQANGIKVKTIPKNNSLFIELVSESLAIKNLYIKWDVHPGNEMYYLGDTWERAYGNLQWLPSDSNRIMPWYFLASNKAITHGYGVMTSPNAMCSWKLNSQEIILRADVRSGGVGLELGKRKLKVCTVTCRKGIPGETPFSATRAFCKQMCPNPKMPKQPLYGFNDWYCDYGNNSAESVLYYATFISRLAPKGTNRPFMLIDDGWQATGAVISNGGPWDTSGKEWSRVLKMGVNCLAFRGPQQETFFAADADCVGLSKTEAIPWVLNRQWLQLVSQSGTPLFISLKKGSVTPDQEKEIAAALLIASKKQPLGEPLDWFETIQPTKWKLMGKVVNFNWNLQ